MGANKGSRTEISKGTYYALRRSKREMGDEQAMYF
jgi:hypothetical protein